MVITKLEYDTNVHQHNVYQLSTWIGISSMLELPKKAGVPGCDCAIMPDKEQWELP